MKNRLNLNFELVYNDERNAFVNSYITQKEFIDRPLTEDELNTIADYILWGKDRATDLNPNQDGSIELKNDWNTDSKYESLDALIESPTFNETLVSELNPALATKIRREVFSRKEALERCPEALQETFRNIFHQIDLLELKINYYELKHGRRINPPRDELLNKFDDEQKSLFQEEIEHWNQYIYLKQRRNLVELRRQQYTLRDSYSAPILVQSSYVNAYDTGVDFDAGIEVLPLGTFDNSKAARLFFRSEDKMNPFEYTKKELDTISDFLWQKKDFKPSGTLKYFDFRNPDHVYQCFQWFLELDDLDDDKHTQWLLRALKFYTDLADLSESQKEILDLKIQKKKNSDIALLINQKYGKHYTPNYISTIFKQRIAGKIVEAAKYHEQIFENIFFEEEFKQCKKCGVWKLRDARNFVRKERSKEGFVNTCKSCGKKKED